MLRIDERTRPWWTLAGACFGLFILMLDSTVVALAISSMRDDAGADSAQLQWVMNGYLLTIAALVVTAGRIGDMFGRRRAFVAGLLLPSSTPITICTTAAFTSEAQGPGWAFSSSGGGNWDALYPAA